MTSPLGQRMAELPLDPRLARALLASADMGCSAEVATVVAMLSVQSVWFGGQGQAALAAAKAKCVSISSNAFSCENLFENVATTGDQRLSRKAVLRCRFAVGEGDLIAYLNVWEAWKGAGERRPSWAHRHCLNHRTLLRAADIRNQLCSHLR